ncbi:MAG TPA: type II secretion system protein [Opitutales bacterium]|nr:type II secretion system protein [Opitutales bacterium]
MNTIQKQTTSRNRSGRNIETIGTRAFTLIELLTVIAIIGILASILIPVTGQVREQGYRAKCQTNIRQQLLAMHMFADDNNNIGYWPVQSSSNDGAPFYLYPDWVDDVDLFICPSTKNVVDIHRVDRAGRVIDLLDNAGGGREDSSGGHSYEYFGYYGAGHPMGAVMKTPITAEGMESISVLIFDGADDPRSQNCPTNSTGNHRDAGFNYGFADGHVEWVPRPQVNRVFERSFHGRWCPGA